MPFQRLDVSATGSVLSYPDRLSDHRTCFKNNTYVCFYFHLLASRAVPTLCITTNVRPRILVCFYTVNKACFRQAEVVACIPGVVLVAAEHLAWRQRRRRAFQSSKRARERGAEVRVRAYMQSRSQTHEHPCATAHDSTHSTTAQSAHDKDRDRDRDCERQRHKNR